MIILTDVETVLERIQSLFKMKTFSNPKQGELIQSDKSINKKPTANYMLSGERFSLKSRKEIKVSPLSTLINPSWCNKARKEI